MGEGQAAASGSNSIFAGPGPCAGLRLLHAEAEKPLLWQGGRSQLSDVPVGLAEPCTMSPLYFQLAFYFPSPGGDPHTHACTHAHTTMRSFLEKDKVVEMLK